MFLHNYGNLPKYYPKTFAKTQLILTHVLLFYRLHHPLPHGSISNITWSVINSALMFTLLAMLSMAKEVKVACLVNES